MDISLNELILTGAATILLWLGFEIRLSANKRRLDQRRQEDAQEARAESVRQQVEQKRHDDELRHALTNELIRRNDELAAQVERLNSERLSDITKLQSEMKSEKERNRIREEGLQRTLDEITTELKQNLEIQTRERDFYRRSITEHAEETRRVNESLGKTLAIAEQLGSENEELRRRVTELETKISGYANLQSQLVAMSEENKQLHAQLATMKEQMSAQKADADQRIQHLEAQVSERDAVIRGLMEKVVALENKAKQQPPMIIDMPTNPESAA